MTKVYEQLAEVLDRLPSGFPRTDTGVEQRILQRLFTQEEAQVALHLTLIPEKAAVIAYRVGRPLAEVQSQLAEMDRKGLIFGVVPPDGEATYSIQQFVVGFWEGQVNRLSRELAEDFEEYLPVVHDLQVWQKAPQLRTIPVGESISYEKEVMPYEQIEALLEEQTLIAVANCICRQEMDLLEHPCDKPHETCLSFGVAAEAYIRNGRGRSISLEEAKTLLKQAEREGLVLQPSNARQPLSLCACCSCCCGVLRSLKRHPQPGSLVASPYRAVLDSEACAGCESCLPRCPMEALTLVAGATTLQVERCIGCGLCVTVCATGALHLERKPAAEQPSLPKDTLGNYLQMGQARGTFGRRELVQLLSQSKQDRQAAESSPISPLSPS